MGISNPGIGLAVYLPIKLVGYTYAAKLLNKNYPEKKNIYLVGVTRTLLGVGFGFTFASLLKEHGHHIPDESALPILIGMLILLRIIEWWLVVWGFYDRKLSTPSKDWGAVVIGIGYSFALDLPAWLFGLMAAGVWIC